MKVIMRLVRIKEPKVTIGYISDVQSDKYDRLVSYLIEDNEIVTTKPDEKLLEQLRASLLSEGMDVLIEEVVS